MRPSTRLPACVLVVIPALLAVVLMASPAASGPAEKPNLVSVSIDGAPWSAIGRINNSAYGRCSAILVRPDTVLTAAHCLYNARSRRFLQPASIHVLFGFDRGRYGFHATVAKIVMAPDYRPADIASAPDDWAVLHLAAPVPDTFALLSLSPTPPSPDDEMQAAGFAQERSEVLTASAPCRSAGLTANGLLVTDCRISHGFSGGPMIDMRTKRVVGMSIAVATANGVERTLAVPASRLQSALDRD